jgi:hypothetical protein
MAIGKTKVRELREKWMEEAASCFIASQGEPDPIEKGKLEARGAAFTVASRDLKEADAAGDAE